MDPAHFWRCTMREIDVILKGASARLQREHDENAWLAWHIAALPMAKKFPKLAEMQSNKPVKRRRKTPEELISMAHLWTAATAGRA